jgi:hypothetical protein
MSGARQVRACGQCRVSPYDCRDFSTQFETQVVYWACGGRQNDVHRLDWDRDGRACAALLLLALFSRTDTGIATGQPLAADPAALRCASAVEGGRVMVGAWSARASRWGTVTSSRASARACVRRDVRTICFGGTKSMTAAGPSTSSSGWGSPSVFSRSVASASKASSRSRVQGSTTSRSAVRPASSVPTTSPALSTQLRRRRPLRPDPDGGWKRWRWRARPWVMTRRASQGRVYASLSRGSYRRGARQPASRASSSEQNHCSPCAVLIRVRSYHCEPQGV